MTIDEVIAVLGEPASSMEFVRDRRTYEFVYGGECEYYVSCTIDQGDGLTHIVVMTADYASIGKQE
jgi:hypothetical protein